MSAAPKHASLFLSYSRADQAQVRSIVRELRAAGADVSYDEMESLVVGDDLANRLRKIVDDYTFLGVVLSTHSVGSNWVARELGWALEAETSHQNTKVLPILIGECNVPAPLLDRVRVDLTDPDGYSENLLALIVRLGGDPLAASRRLYPLLESLAREVADDAVMEATIDALRWSRVPGTVLEAAIRELLPQATPNAILGLAKLCIYLADDVHEHYELAEELVGDQRFPDYGIPTLSAIGRSLSDDTVTDWWHGVFVRRIAEDAYYNTLIEAHAASLMARRYNEVAAYLLHPNRGPADYNVDSMCAAIVHTDRPYPFVRRMNEWIFSGKFDGRTEQSDSDVPHILYACLKNGLECDSEPIRDIAVSAVEHVRSLIVTGNPRAAVAHLKAMLDNEFALPDLVVDRILDRLWNGTSPYFLHIAPVLRTAFVALAEYQRSGREDRRALDDAKRQLNRAKESS